MERKTTVRCCNMATCVTGPALSVGIKVCVYFKLIALPVSSAANNIKWGLLELTDAYYKFNN